MLLRQAFSIVEIIWPHFLRSGSIGALEMLQFFLTCKVQVSEESKEPLMPPRALLSMLKRGEDMQHKKPKLRPTAKPSFDLMAHHETSMQTAPVCSLLGKRCLTADLPLKRVHSNGATSWKSYLQAPSCIHLTCLRSARVTTLRAFHDNLHDDLRKPLPKTPTTLNLPVGEAREVGGQPLECILCDGKPSSVFRLSGWGCTVEYNSLQDEPEPAGKISSCCEKLRLDRMAYPEAFLPWLLAATH